MQIFLDYAVHKSEDKQSKADPRQYVAGNGKVGIAYFGKSSQYGIQRAYKESAPYLPEKIKNKIQVNTKVGEKKSG